MAEPIYVIAGDYAEFCLWARENGYTSGDPAIRYVFNVRQFLGLDHEPDVVRTGTWAQRIDIAQIRQQLAILRARP